jgi:hypothetical protein
LQRFSNGLSDQLSQASLRLWQKQMAQSDVVGIVGAMMHGSRAAARRAKINNNNNNNNSNDNDIIGGSVDDKAARRRAMMAQRSFSDAPSHSPSLAPKNDKRTSTTTAAAMMSKSFTPSSSSSSSSHYQPLPDGLFRLGDADVSSSYESLDEVVRISRVYPFLFRSKAFLFILL